MQQNRRNDPNLEVQSKNKWIFKLQKESYLHSGFEHDPLE